MGNYGWELREFDRQQAEKRAVWDHKVQQERKRQIEKGYDAAHDDEHGIEHLLTWAREYAFRGEPIKSAALVEAAREKLRRDSEPHVEGSDHG